MTSVWLQYDGIICECLINHHIISSPLIVCFLHLRRRMGRRGQKGGWAVWWYAEFCRSEGKKINCEYEPFYTLQSCSARLHLPRATGNENKVIVSVTISNFFTHLARERYFSTVVSFQGHILSFVSLLTVRRWSTKVIQEETTKDEQTERSRTEATREQTGRGRNARRHRQGSQTSSLLKGLSSSLSSLLVERKNIFRLSLRLTFCINQSLI